MTTSFFNGISGIKSFQNGIDIWGDNIANINTIGYKKNTPEFETIFASTLSSTASTTSDISYGSVFNSSSKNFSSGSFIKSDNPFDLAINGDAFFKVDNFYTKNGQFNLDSEGYLVDDNGHYLQGNMLYKGNSDIIDKNLIIDKNNYQNFDENTLLSQELSKIKLPSILYSPAKKTENISLQASLSNEMKTPILSNKNAAINSEYIKLNNDYIPTNLEDNDEMIVGFGNFNIDGDLIYTDISLDNISFPLIIDTKINDKEIKLEFKDTNTSIDEIKKTISEELNKYNIKNTLLSNGIKICSSDKLIIKSNDTLFQNVAAQKIIYSSNPNTDYEFHTNEDLTNILDNLIKNLDSNTSVTFENGKFNFLNNSNQDIKFELIAQNEKISNFASIFPSIINANSIEESQPLYLNKQDFSGYFYDEKGEKHILTFSFIKIDNNKFIINVLDENKNSLITQELIYENQKFTPNEFKINDMNIKLDLSLQNSILYNYIFSQDGFPQGKLKEYNIDNNGTIIAYFDNSKEAILGKIPLFHFQNNQGLEAIGSSLFIETSNSGAKLIANSPDKNIAFIKSRMLESSNVKMNEAMTELIIMQKAFNASAKTVTTSDEMIQKAINMKH